MSDKVGAMCVMKDGSAVPAAQVLTLFAGFLSLRLQLTNVFYLPLTGNYLLSMFGCLVSCQLQLVTVSKKL